MLDYDFKGGYGEGDTPVPIPNTAVKPLCADDTIREAVWESRSPPTLFYMNKTSFFILIIQNKHIYYPKLTTNMFNYEEKQ